jgi:hypothetical protein
VSDTVSPTITIGGQIILNPTTMENVFTVGNGEFGFTADLTGLQSMNAS